MLGCYPECSGEPVTGFKEGRVSTACVFRKVAGYLQGRCIREVQGCTCLEAAVGPRGI